MVSKWQVPVPEHEKKPQNRLLAKSFLHSFKFTATLNQAIYNLIKQRTYL